MSPTGFVVLDPGDKVALASSDTGVGKLRGGEGDFYPPPTSVGDRIRRAVTERITVGKFHPDLVVDLFQVVGGIREAGAADGPKQRLGNGGAGYRKCGDTEGDPAWQRQHRPLASYPIDGETLATTIAPTP